MNMKYDKCKIFGTSAALVLTLSACTPQMNIAVPAASTESQTQPTQQATTVPRNWDDVVELVNLAGDSTTVYLLADGRYLDRQNRFFTYDGVQTWTCDDGSIWNRKADSTAVTGGNSDTAPSATNVYAEFAIERLLAQRPDHIAFSEGAGDKIVLTFDTAVTEFRFLELQGSSFDDAGNFSCTGVRELYTCDLILDSDLMVVQTQLEGLVPTRGFSFKDGAGNIRYDYLALSGEDNVPLVVRFNFRG